MVTTRPLIAGYATDGALGAHRERVLHVGAFIAAARSLAARLPQADCALLLCQDRLAFAVGFAAMLLRRTTALLPPSQAPQALANVARTRAAGFALVDRLRTIEGTTEIVVDPWSGGEADLEIPLIPDQHVAAIVYTSGTTGDPQPHVKTWASLVRGAAALRARVGFAAGDMLAGAVPPQHMWGLEASVMLPLQGGGVIHAGVPLLPHDIAAALAELATRRWLVLTPVHARTCVQASARLPALIAALSATTPLDFELARAFERLSGAPLIEIYGSTETGVIATRQPARDERFLPLEGIIVTTTEDGGLAVSGGHIDEAVRLGDRALVSADGRLTLAGRDADLVKVGGKRASLSMLERELSAIPGVLDGALVVVDSGALTPRLAALVVAPTLERAQILAALRERIDPVFLPRPLHRVDALPRNALGKTSASVLRQRVAELSSAAAHSVQDPPGTLACDRLVPASHPALAGHFPGRPIVPAAWLLSLVDHAYRETYGNGTAVCGIVYARFRAPLAPETPLRIEFARAEHGRMTFSCISGTTRLADGVLATTERRS